jgi:hypothetical protein
MESKLPELVARMAAAPTDENREAFYRALASSQVLFPSQPPATGPGRYAVKQGDQFTLTAVPGPAGEKMLVLFANREALGAFHPGQPYAEIDAPVVLRLAQENGYGVIIQSVHEGKASWAGVRPEHVTGVLEQAPPPRS